MYILMGVLCYFVAIMTGVLPFHSSALDWCAFCLGKFHFVVLFLPSSVTVFVKLCLVIVYFLQIYTYVFPSKLIKKLIGDFYLLRNCLQAHISTF